MYSPTDLFLLKGFWKFLDFKHDCNFLSEYTVERILVVLGCYHTWWCFYVPDRLPPRSFQSARFPVRNFHRDSLLYRSSARLPPLNWYVKEQDYFMNWRYFFFYGKSWNGKRYPKEKETHICHGSDSNYWLPTKVQFQFLTIWYFQPFSDAGLQSARDQPSP